MWANMLRAAGAAARRVRPYLTSATMGRRMGPAPISWWPKLDGVMAAHPTIVPPLPSLWDLPELTLEPMVDVPAEPLDFLSQIGTPRLIFHVPWQ